MQGTLQCCHWTVLQKSCNTNFSQFHLTFSFKCVLLRVNINIKFSGKLCTFFESHKWLYAWLNCWFWFVICKERRKVFQEQSFSYILLILFTFARSRTRKLWRRRNGASHTVQCRILVIFINQVFSNHYYFTKTQKTYT